MAIVEDKSEEPFRLSTGLYPNVLTKRQLNSNLGHATLRKLSRDP